MVQVRVACDADREVCEKVHLNTRRVVKFFTNAILFKQKINVHVTYTSCQKIRRITNLAARNTIPYEPLVMDDDGKERAHEMLHLLGFKSAFRLQLFGMVSPEISPLKDDNGFMAKFYDLPFDRHVFINGTFKLTDFTSKLNQMDRLKYNHLFNLTKLQKTPQYILFKALSLHLTQPNGVFFSVNQHCNVTLESSFHPFREGSSLIHLDARLNHHRRDDLITYSLSNGYAFSRYLMLSPNWAQSPFGSRTLAILEKLGYTLNPNPNLSNSLSYLYMAMLNKTRLP
ncbi:hypothetical protein L0F63_002184 [Massospora cicadina]|nr:hypothetical protein L0F63_002184 [Massospora cicadina]